MHRRLSPLAWFTAALALAACKPAASTPGPADAPPGGGSGGGEVAAKSAYDYPLTRKGDTVDSYHGAQVTDPYRWLEELDTDETRAWVEAQNKLTFGVLGSIKQRDAIRTRLTELWNYERYGVPYKEGGKYFYSRNDGLQNQSVLYVADSLAAEPRVLIDPNTLSQDGTVALSGTAISQDGKYVAYGLAAAGSDWQEYRVREIATGKDLDDHLKWIKFSGAAWTKDSKGFFYSRYDAPGDGEALKGKNEFQKLYYHKIGTPQDKDILVYERKDHPQWGFGGEVSDDGRWLVIRVWEGSADKNALFVHDLSGGVGKKPVVELLNKFDAEYTFVGSKGSNLYIQTTQGATRGKVVAIDAAKKDAGDPSAWKVLVPEAPETLRSVSHVGGKLIASYLKDARSEVRVFNESGKLERDITLPGLGTAAGFGGRAKDGETFYAFTSYTWPTTIFRYDLKTGTSEVFRQPKVAFDPSKYETTQVFYTSKDGTKVPMFLTHKKGLERNGQNPTYLYGYGGFNVALTPGFSVPDLMWLELGGVLAVANLRGGGEYGEAWHEAGTKLHKQNVFDDFIGAAEYLVAEKVTSPGKLAIGGRSNGGLLVGAAMTQRPDLFAVALPGVGVMDMLRFHKFTIGWAWVSDYGSSDDAEQFKALRAYSPLHNLKAGTKYPATLVYTADHDDRVVPGHSYKFAAALQAAQSGDKPALIRIDVRAGHGAGKPTSKQIEEWTDLWGFVVHNLGMTL
ncbi:prolyl oligopeptidase family serine peptidase [Nannocystis sp. ILAH1]|uniref:prolyl oligopeptidase family serine peptidase n=1 Tax=unclassified Nannocystis TaxID=2627009 RepID=UPI00226FEDA2|nr:MULTISPECIES: prolyl oligopeptidase family serine peptidase [unclassified Nannocystis]MCY0985649.1 prolyl oligopeptidase family serine peptidase [Nannocystis sp. ILAH1]MCY1068335.1 prolyl oligopeptidase family serine peptidase [Nannocystis sp. RBIL2]